VRACTSHKTHRAIPASTQSTSPPWGQLKSPIIRLASRSQIGLHGCLSEFMSVRTGVHHRRRCLLWWTFCGFYQLRARLCRRHTMAFLLAWALLGRNCGERSRKPQRPISSPQGSWTNGLGFSSILLPLQIARKHSPWHMM
jgi:hypothetical protein